MSFVSFVVWSARSRAINLVNPSVIAEKRLFGSFLEVLFPAFPGETCESFAGRLCSDARVVAKELGAATV